jgi:hypothetical protein
MNGAFQLLVYGDNLWGENIHNMEKNTKEFLVAGKGGVRLDGYTG